jgi:hypothetical protein
VIAISYRRQDSLPVAGRLYDKLQGEFGKGNVFMDFDSIPYGVDFRQHIKDMASIHPGYPPACRPWLCRRAEAGRRRSVGPVQDCPLSPFSHASAPSWDSEEVETLIVESTARERAFS